MSNVQESLFLVRGGRLAGWAVVAGIVVQTVLVVYLVFFQPPQRYDKKFQTLTDSYLDMETRIVQVERENIMLFRMLRNENDRHGVIPEPIMLPEPEFPLPQPPAPRPARRTGDMPGESMGDISPG